MKKRRPTKRQLTIVERFERDLARVRAERLARERAGNIIPFRPRERFVTKPLSRGSDDGDAA